MKLKEIFPHIFQTKKEKEKEKKAKLRKRLILILTIFFAIVIVVALLVGPVLAYEMMYKEKIYAGIYIDGIYVGGLTQQEAIDKLNQHLDNLSGQGLNFVYQNEKSNVGFLMVSPEDPDLAFNLLSMEIEAMVEEAYAYGRTPSWLTNGITQFQAILDKRVIAMQYVLNETELVNILQNRYISFENPGKNAEITFKTEKDYEIGLEKSGFVIDYDLAITDLKNELNFININTIHLQTKESVPRVTKVDAELARPILNNTLKKESLILSYDDTQWVINNEEFKNWLQFDKDEEKNIIVNFNPEKLTKKLQEVALEIDVAPQDAKFNFADNKVTEFMPHKLGLQLDIDKSFELINQQFFAEEQENKIEEADTEKGVIALIVNQSEPEILTAEVNNYGITEIIGVGESDFSGSSSNRIGNIRNAATILHGTLIKPDEEFSLVDAVGEVNAATGFFPEYVIKGDRTIKEYGGGLCQIATTTFRVAMYSGLEITERKPHSYIVSYYNPVGFDAAIYGPHPDVRFINDTGHYILLQTEMEGTELTFTFWGKSDGREVEITHPEVYNWRSPPAAKLIENPALAPGEKKLIEYSKSGADTHFYRYIVRSGQEKEEEIWRSHYVAWPAIYEVGVEENTEGEEGGEGNDTLPDENLSTGENPQADENNTEEE
ncbi:VanW family protein [Patescibacteria group bacterium]